MNVSLGQLLPGQPMPPDIAGIAVRSLSIDSRQAVAGDLFVAMPGATSDGRKFIEDALGKGVSVVLAEEDAFVINTQNNVPVLGVPELRRQLGEIAGRFHGEPAKKLKVIGVTGTNGKTSISWFLRAALEAADEPCALVGTLGMNFAGEQIDTGHTTPDPLILHRGLAHFVDAGARAVVMEVSSHALEQHRLSGVPVALAIFSNLSRDHLDYHADMESYFAAKARLFNEHKPTLAVINMDQPAGRRLAQGLSPQTRLIGFSVEPGQHVYCQSVDASEAGLACVLNVDGSSVSLRLPLFGLFNLENLLAVAAALHGLGLSAEQIEQAMSAITPVPGRMQPVNTAGRPRVLVDYAHTPQALEKALQATRQHFSGRLHCVVGCGGDRDRGKRAEMAAVAEQFSDRLVLTSDNPRSEPPQAILDEMRAGLRHPQSAESIVDRPAAVAAAIAGAAAEDVVLIAGKGHEQWQEIAGQKIAMNDLQLARDALAQRRGVEQ